MKAINAIRMGGVDVLPLVEGGKGISISNGISSGRWAFAGGVGTFSAVNADSFDDQGHRIPQVYRGRTRRERHEELVAYAVQGALTQARRAYDLASGMGRIHANILWEMGAAERIITEVLEQAKGIINGITCGAGMPYRLSDIAARFNVLLLPHHLLGACVQCAVEARLLEGCVAAWRRGVRGPLASRRPQRPVQR